MTDTLKLTFKINDRLEVNKAYKKVPLIVDHNGTYVANADSGGFSPVTVRTAMDTTATAEDIFSGKTAYISGKKVTGSLNPKAKALKELIDARQSARLLFDSYTGEDVSDWLDFDTTENSKNFVDMFYMSRITKIPPFNIKSTTSLDCVFRLTSRLENAPVLDTKHITNFNSVFNQNTVLQVIPEWDVRNGLNFTSAFNSNYNMTEIRFKNIKATIQVGSGTIWGTKLTLENLIYLIGELRDTGSLLTFTVGSANYDKLKNIYVRTIPITDEMRANDDLIDEKLPFEVCESTDERACLIKDYMSFKNWLIA